MSGSKLTRGILLFRIYLNAFFDSTTGEVGFDAGFGALFSPPNSVKSDILHHQRYEITINSHTYYGDSKLFKEGRFNPGCGISWKEGKEDLGRLDKRHHSILLYGCAMKNILGKSLRKVKKQNSGPVRPF